jgi:hypothetical protein
MRVPSAVNYIWNSKYERVRNMDSVVTLMINQSSSQPPKPEECCWGALAFPNMFAIDFNSLRV